MIFRLGPQFSQRSGLSSRLSSGKRTSLGARSLILSSSSERRDFSSTVSYVMDENFVKFQLYEVLKVESELFEKVTISSFLSFSDDRYRLFPFKGRKIPTRHP
jgi:hypothetical protein